MSKRARDDLDQDAVAAAAMELGGVLSRGLDVKLMALERIRELIDHHDHVYTNQKALVDSEAAFYLCELLDDDSPAVGIRAADVIALMTEHSATAKARLHAGPLIGLESNVAKVMLNPVQNDFSDAGAVQKLAPWLVSGVPQKVDAAVQALANISSYNFEAKMAYLECLVDLLVLHNHSNNVSIVLEHLEDVVEGLDTTSVQNDDTLQLLEKALKPTLAPLKSPSSPETVQHAIAFLGTLCEKVPALAKELRETTDAAALLARNIVFGSLQTQDYAVNALYYLSLGDQVRVLGPDGPLAQHAEAVARVLQMLVEKSAKEEEEEEAKERDGRDDNKSDDEDRPGVLNAISGAEGWSGSREEVLFAEEAKEMLNTLATYNPDLHINDSGENMQQRSSCCVM